MFNQDIIDTLENKWRAYWESAPEFDLVEWLESNVYLDKNVSPVKEGFIDLRFSPYVKEMLYDYLDPYTEFIVAMMASQTGKSMYSLLVKVLQIKFDPAPALMVYPNDKLATRVLEKRINPLIKANTFLQDELKPCRDPITKSKILFNRMDCYIVGAGSPTNISSDTIKYLDLDETAKFKSTNTNEKDVVGNAIIRTKLLEGKGRKVNILSTPALKGDAICAEFEKCDCVRNWEILDPKTGEYFAPEFENLKWTGDTVEEWQETIHIEAPSGYKIFQNEKNKLIRNGRATPRPERVRRVAWRVPSWLSQFVSLQYIAKQWFDAQGDIEKIQGFKNNECALPFEITGDNDSDEPIKTKVLDYLTGEFPINEACAVFITADVQNDRFPFVARIHTTKASYLYKYGEAMSADEVISLTYDLPNCVQFVCVGFDTQYRKKEMIEFIKQHSSKAIPLQGSTQGVTSTAVFKTFPSERLPDGKPDPRSINVYHLNRNSCADLLLETIKSDAIKWHIPNDMPEQYFSEMTAERRILIKSRSGYEKHEWRKTKRDNHALDCEVYQIAMRSIFRVQLMEIERMTAPEAKRPPRVPRPEQKKKNKRPSIWERHR